MPRLRPGRRTPTRLGCLAVALCIAACSPAGRSDHTPPDEVARKALDASLSAWKKGDKPGTIEGASPPVTAVDSQWQTGAMLAGYEILGEEPGDGNRRFSVRLTVKDPVSRKEAPQDTRYVVVGL